MLGNDLVDLADPESLPGSLHPRFDARVFDTSERAGIGGPGGDVLRWVLWAAKESAYKAVRRLDPGTIFSPRRFGVRLRKAGAKRWVGRVRHANRLCRVDARVRGTRVHAVALVEGRTASDLIVGAAGTAGPAPSQAVRDLARARLAEWLAEDAGDVGFGRRGRVPCVRVRGRTLPVILSFSHHGRYVGFAALRGVHAGGSPA